MTTMILQTEGGYEADTTSDLAQADDAPSVRIANPDAEDGQPQAGPLWWLNSAAVRIDPNDDAVHLTASVGDPRGAFCMTLRRLPDGRIVIHLPHPGQSMPHVETATLHEGTLVLTHEAGDASRAVIFEEPEPEDEDDV